MVALGQQDSLIVPSIDFSQIVVDNCAHGHSCCASYCPCCPELSRPQVYDTLHLWNDPNSKGVVVLERYAVALSHNHSTVEFLFTNGDKQKRFFSKRFERWSGDFRDKERRKGREIPFFEKGYEVVFDEDRNYYLIDKAGKKLTPDLPVEYDLGKGQKKSGLLLKHAVYFALLNDQGKQLTPYRYHSIGSFTDKDVAIVGLDYHAFGLLNRNGEEIIPCRRGRIEDLGEGYYSVETNTGVHLFDWEGRQITQEGYSRIGKMGGGIFAVVKNEMTGYIDVNGTTVIPHEFKFGQTFSNGYAAVYKDKKWGYINKKGVLVIPYLYDRAIRFSEKMSAVAIGEDSNRDHWRFINSKGKFIGSKEFGEVSEFKNGIAKVSSNDGSEMINVHGKTLLSKRYFLANDGRRDSWFEDGYVLVRERLEYRRLRLLVMNQAFEEVLDLKDYEAAYFLSRNAYEGIDEVLGIQVYKNSKIGILNLEGDLILPVEFDRVICRRAYFAVLQKGKSFYQFNFRTSELKRITEGELKETITGNVLRIKKSDGSTMMINLKGDPVNQYTYNHEHYD